MKKIYLLTLLVCCLLKLNAQRFSIGPTVGFGHSWIGHVNKFSNSEFNRNFFPAWNAGLSFNYITKKHFGVSVDVINSADGDKAHTKGFFGGDVVYPAGISIYHLNYIRIPVKFIYLFSENKSIIQPKIYAGPSFGFLTDAKNVFKVDGGDKFLSDVNQFKKFDFGAIAAAGLNINFNKIITLSTAIQYYQGLIDIMRDYSPAYHITGYNGNIQINTALLFNL